VLRGDYGQVVFSQSDSGVINGSHAGTLFLRGTILNPGEITWEVYLALSASPVARLDGNPSRVESLFEDLEIAIELKVLCSFMKRLLSRSHPTFSRNA